MKSVLKTFGIRFANIIAIPIFWLSGLVSVFLLYFMLPSSPTPTFNVYEVFSVAFSLFCLCMGYWKWRRRRATKLVASVNLEAGLSLDDTQLLGYPKPLFVAFDRSNQKLAKFQMATGDYHIHDLSWITGWQLEWLRIENMSGVSRLIDSAGTNIPAFEINTGFTRYAMVLQTADTEQPALRFKMNRTDSEKWCAWCAAIFQTPAVKSTHTHDLAVSKNPAHCANPPGCEQPGEMPMETDPVCLIFIPALVAILTAAENEKGSPLTEEEVVSIRDRSTCMTVRFSVALDMEKARGYPDIVAENCWEEWQNHREQLT